MSDPLHDNDDDREALALNNIEALPEPTDEGPQDNE